MLRIAGADPGRGDPGRGRRDAARCASPITDDAARRLETLYWVLVVGIAGFGAAYYARGFLAGRRQFGLYATLLVLEGGSRLMFPVAVAVGIAEGIDAVALGIAVAPLAGLAVLPFAFARHRAPRRRRSGRRRRRARVHAGARRRVRRGGAADDALRADPGQLGGAVRPRRARRRRRPGFIFNVMMVARAPLLLFQAVAASLLPHLTRLRTRGDATGEDAFRMSVNNTLLIIVGFAAAVTVGVLADRARR